MLPTTCRASEGYSLQADIEADPFVWHLEDAFSHHSEIRRVEGLEGIDVPKILSGEEVARRVADIQEQSEKGATSATEMPPAPSAVARGVGLDKEMVQDLLKMHHSITALLATVKVNACVEFVKKDPAKVLSMVTHQDKVCSICGKELRSAPRLRRHIQKRHIGVTPYQCKTCQKFFTSNQALIGHQAQHVSPTLKTIPCPAPKCVARNVTFLTEDQLAKHMVNHGEKKYKCQYCGLGFVRKYNCQNHEKKSCPKGPQPDLERCQFPGCKAAYKQEKDLRRHWVEVPEHCPDWYHPE